jgi:hygromycin-B 7''-O-kinase
MTEPERKYSERLGFISDDQFQQALDKFNLGTFIVAQPVSQGLFGQNVFITSTKGEFVLRGVPHYPWQFKSEKVFADLLHDNTTVPVPYPYLLEMDTTIFGWEFVIMPRMKGINLSDSLDETNFTEEDKAGISEAQGKILREAQKLTSPFCGEYNSEVDRILPYETDWLDMYKKRTLNRIIGASSYNNLTPDSDIRWAGEIIEKAGFEVTGFTPTFCMQDFKPGNMVVEKINGKWRVSGLFDLMESSFGHPEADISRLFGVYIGEGRNDLAYTFINAYSPDDVEGFIKRFPLFMFHDRAIAWEYVQRNDVSWWDKSLNFRQWIEEFLVIDPGKLI